MVTRVVSAAAAPAVSGVVAAVAVTRIVPAVAVAGIVPAVVGPVTCSVTQLYKVSSNHSSRSKPHINQYHKGLRKKSNSYQHLEQTLYRR